MDETRRTHLAAIPPIPAILAGIISVQAGAALAKGLFPALGPVGTVGLRVGLSAIMLVAAFRPGLRGTTAAQWRAVIPYGVVLGTMNIVFYLSLSRIPLGVAVTVEFVGPLAVAVFGSRRAVDMAWVVLAAAGIALITPWSGGGADLAGVLLALAAGACWAAYILLSQRVGRLFGGASGLAVAMTVGALVAAPLGIAQAGGALLHPGLLAATAAVALGSSVIPYSFEMEALRTLPAQTFGILMSLEPAIAALAGLAVLGQSLSLREWFAIGLVVAASAGATAGARPGDEPVSG